MHTKKENLPVALGSDDTNLRSAPGYGGMTMACNEIPEGTDVSPMLEGLKNDMCQCPHWGYLREGEMEVKYEDGKEETLHGGDVYYLPPGHTAIVTKDVEAIEFKPEQKHKELMDHLEAKMKEAEN